MDTYNCIEYKPTFIDVFVPSYQIIYKLCLSTDKTKLFLMSLCRLIFWGIIFAFLVNGKYIGQDNDAIVYLILLTYIVINLAYIIIVIFKSPVIDKKVMDRISSNIAKEIKTTPITLPKIIN